MLFLAVNIKFEATIKLMNKQTTTNNIIINKHPIITKIKILILMRQSTVHMQNYRKVLTNGFPAQNSEQGPNFFPISLPQGF